MFWPTSPGFALLCPAELTSNSFRLSFARFGLLSGAWYPVHFIDSRPSLQVSVHSWREVDVRWWIVKLTMLGLIKDEKTNDSPFWLVSTRPSRLTFYWYRTFNRSDAPKLWSLAPANWWCTIWSHDKSHQPKLVSTPPKPTVLRWEKLNLCWLIMKNTQFDFPLRDQSSPKLTSAHLTYMQVWWDVNNPTPSLPHGSCIQC